MQTCGSIISQNPSQLSIDASTSLARTAILDEITRVRLLSSPISLDPETPQIMEQLNLLFAVDFLQAIHIFDHRVSVRRLCNVDHERFVRCVQVSELIPAVMSWCPNLGDLSDSAIERAWRSWARYEELKRFVYFEMAPAYSSLISRSALWISQIQDFIQVAMYGGEAAYTEEDRSFCLPSEDALWEASDAHAWYLVLKKTRSPYGSVKERMLGIMWNTAIANFKDQFAEPMPLNPAAHYILIRYIRSRMGPCVQSPVSGPTVVRPELALVQQMLRNWLHSWRASPLPSYVGAQSMHNLCMTFYWTTQLSIFGHRSGLFPIVFDGWAFDVANFLMTMHWMKQIRVSLEVLGHYDAPIADVLWSGLMRIRSEICNVRSMDAVEYLEGISSFLRL
jgi:hypothetical protein